MIDTRTRPACPDWCVTTHDDSPGGDEDNQCQGGEASLDYDGLDISVEPMRSTVKVNDDEWSDPVGIVFLILRGGGDPDFTPDQARTLGAMLIEAASAAETGGAWKPSAAVAL